METIVRLFAASRILSTAVPVWLLFLFPAWVSGLISLRRTHRTSVEFTVELDGQPSWWIAAWLRWDGLSLPFAIVLKKQSSREHELRHSWQWLVLGPLFPVVYLVMFIVFGYRNHPLERDARRHG